MSFSKKNFQSNLNVMAENTKAKESEAGDGTGAEKSADGKEKKESGVPDLDKEKTTQSNGTQGGTGGVKVIDDEAFFKYASEKLEKEVTSFEDLVVEKEKTIDYASEFSRKYDEFYKETKGSVEQFQFVQKDVEEMDQEFLIRENLSVENPGLDQDDLNDLYDDMYSFDEEFDDEKLVRRRKIAGKQAAAKSKEVLKKKQENWKLPVKDSGDSEPSFQDKLEAYNKKAKEDFETTSTNWKTALGESTKDFDGVSLKIAEDMDFKFSPTTEQKTDTYNVASDVTFQELVKPFRNKEGAVDTKALHEAIFKMKHFDEIFEPAIKQAIAYGQELEIKKRVNPRNSRSKGPDISTKGLSDEDKFRLKMMKSAKYKG